MYRCYFFLNFFCTNIDDDNIYNAVSRCGLVEYWKTDKVTNMSKLFEWSYDNFNVNLWNVSNVTNMSYMFAFAELFNYWILGMFAM